MERDIKDAEHEAPPSPDEQREAREKQESAEKRWRPEDAEWAEVAVSEHPDVLFQSIFNRAAIGIALVDLEGRISKANHALCDMLGSDDLVGRAFTDIALPEDAALDQRLFEGLLNGDHDHYTFEKRYRRTDGNVLWGRLTVSLITGGDGLPQFVIGVVEDVTQRVRAQEDARHRDRAIRKAYADVISAVTAGRFVLLDDDEIEEVLGRPISPPCQVPTSKDIGRARHLLREMLSEVANDAPCVDDLLVAASEALTNALRHAGRCEWRLRQREGRLQVEVSDDGEGIPFADLPQLALVPGVSTAESLGMGFTVMLAACDRIVLSTGEHGTRILLECEYALGDRAVPQSPMQLLGMALAGRSD